MKALSTQIEQLRETLSSSYCTKEDLNRNILSAFSALEQRIVQLEESQILIFQQIAQQSKTTGYEAKSGQSSVLSLIDTNSESKQGRQSTHWDEMS